MSRAARQRAGVVRPAGRSSKRAAARHEARKAVALKREARHA
jgi:hypothetical protein